MKRISLLLALPLIIFSSCRKEVTEVQQVDQAFSAVYTIESNDWIASDGGRVQAAELEVPELDNIIYQDGAVLVYLSFAGTDYYEGLPQVFDGITYGVLHSDGYITIEMTALSGDVVAPPGGNVSAKVVLIDATRLALRKDVNLKDLKSVERAFNIK